MKNVDYIIVGFGIAGLSFAETLRQNNKSFVVIADHKDGATSASGGVLNPTVLKRFTAAWKAKEFQEKAIPFYNEMSRYLGEKVISQIAIKRILNSIEEQNDWMVASDKIEMKSFLDSQLVTSKNEKVKAPLKLGVVVGGYQLKPSELLTTYLDKLKDNECFSQAGFDYSQLVVSNEGVQYKQWSSTQIVFAEGAGVVNNPFYPYHAPFTNKSVLVGNKGDYIIIKAPELQVTSILKGGMMLIPLGNDLYKIGATYDRHIYNSIPSTDKREEIIVKLDKMITCDYQVVDQVAGVRPTIKDRRPIIGMLKDKPQIAFLNGLGTRGLSMAPLLSYWLFQELENGTNVPEEVNINRFLK